MQFDKVVLICLVLNYASALKLRSHEPPQPPPAPGSGMVDTAPPKAPGLRVPNFVWSPLWTQFQAICYSRLNGVMMPDMPKKVTLLAKNNHGLCFQSTAISQLCKCRSRENFPDVPKMTPYETFKNDFNWTHWKLEMGHTCRDHGFDTAGHAFSLKPDWADTKFDEDCQAEYWQIQMRKDWYAFRQAWQYYLKGEMSFQESGEHMAEHFVFPWTLLTPGAPAPTFMTMHTKAETAGALTGHWDMSYCNGLNSTVCGPNGRSQSAIAPAFCQTGPNTGYVEDEINIFNPSNISERPPAQIGQYGMVYDGGFWKIFSLGPGLPVRDHKVDNDLTCKLFENMDGDR